MQSTKKTTFAVLRQKLGLSVQEFAKLIKKSVGTINSLETGRLRLSPETAHFVTEQTGVALEWILEGKPEEEPYWLDQVDGHKHPWTKQIFEEIQAHKLSADSKIRIKNPRPGWRLIRALMATGRWLSIYSWAEKNGQAEVAQYRMTSFLNDLAKLFGTDDAGAVRLCQNTELRLKDGTQWSFQPEAGQLYLRLESKL
jgi:transcriptional regulator with XRE-family HTH domain